MVLDNFVWYESNLNATPGGRGNEKGIFAVLKKVYEQLEGGGRLRVSDILRAHYNGVPAGGPIVSSRTDVPDGGVATLSIPPHRILRWCSITFTQLICPGYTMGTLHPYELKQAHLIQKGGLEINRRDKWRPRFQKRGLNTDRSGGELDAPCGHRVSIAKESEDGRCKEDRM